MTTAACYFCHEPVTVGMIGTWRLVEGIAMTREGGGAHSVHQRVELHQYAHDGCINLRDPHGQIYHAGFYCRDCRESSTGDTVGAGVFTKGWVQEREGGGAHGISLRRDTNTGVCPDCMSKRLRGVHPDQQSLL